MAPVGEPGGRVTLVEAQTFCISSSSGDMHEALPEGLFFLDSHTTRYGSQSHHSNRNSPRQWSTI